MRTLFGVFVLGILSTTAFSNDICLRPDGCHIDMESGICTECVSLTPDNVPTPPSCADDYFVCKNRWSTSPVCEASLKECKMKSVKRSR